MTDNFERPSDPSASSFEPAYVDQPALQESPVVLGPLPVCDYTTDSDVPCEEPARQKRWSSVAVVVAASLGAVVGGLLVAATALWLFSGVPGVEPSGAKAKASATPAAATVASLTIAPSGTVSRAVAVAAKAQPSVVNITVRQAGVDPFTGQQFTQETGNGSGVIIRSDGYILTNNHVVEDASELLVSYGRQNKVAHIVGADPLTDLAVIKIDGAGYPAIGIGSSEGLKVGQFVLAIGSPFGLDKTVTEGIISALQRTESARSNNNITTYTNLIQTDAAINPGNSGGALVDETGKLIGINTLIQSPAGDVGAAQSAGIGFAIPIDFAMPIAEQLISTGKATHPYTGIQVQSMDDFIAAQLGVAQSTGALVRFVDVGSPAEKAGITRGDVIVKVGDTEIGTLEDYFAAIGGFKIGDAVSFEVLRGQQTKTFQITLTSDAAQ